MDTRKVVVDPGLCIVCGDCSRICPVYVYNISPPPCQRACPVGTDISANITSIIQGNLDEALAAIRQSNPLPGITGRVCPHPCEAECRRSEIDQPVAIQALERFTADHGPDYPPDPVEKKAAQVAVIGSGPAGLAAAADLARRGYPVTIFESLPVAGGLLSVGIPEYRLPREIVRREIGRIERLGVDIRLNSPVGGDSTLKGLLGQGYRVVLVAIGTHRGLKLDIPGEGELQGVEDAMSFLRGVNLGGPRRVTGQAIVVGGGNAAVDAARTLLRLGASGVALVYRRSRQEMPAIASEVAEAEREGVKVHYLVAPRRVLGKGGKVTGMECVRTELGAPDASGRRAPRSVAGSEFVLEAGLIISAIGQQPDLSRWREAGDIGAAGGSVAVDGDTMMTALPGVFAAGDAVSGPGTVVEAMASGRRAAAAINRYLGGTEPAQAGNGARAAGGEAAPSTWWKETGKEPRPAVDELPVAKRRGNFSEIVPGLPQDLAVREARRCLGCAIFAHNDLASCCGDSCRCCQYHCWQGAIKIY